MNWFIIIPVAIVIVMVILFTIKRNQKDEKEFEQQLNNDYPVSDDIPKDADGEETTK